MKDTLITTAIVLLLFATAIITVPLVLSDDDGEWGAYRQHSIGVAAVADPVYTQECGSCHMAYPPGLLPARSWNKLMAGLEDHFGDNAELEASLHQSISTYLAGNSADRSSYRRSRKIDASINAGEAPLRITETPYFRHEHDEIPARMVQDNPEVRSFSNCNACHSKAQQGWFDEDGVRIPGVGAWHD